MRVVVDIETDKLHDPEYIWVICCKDIDSGQYHIFREVTKSEKEKKRFLDFASGIHLWIGHNFLEFDYPTLARLVGLSVPDIPNICIDTLIVSRLVDYSREYGHSLDQFGYELGLEKIYFKDFSAYSKEMETYCVRDVDLTHQVYLRFLDIISDLAWLPSIKLEQQFQLILNSVHDRGFAFNSTEANILLEQVKEELHALDTEIEKEFLPKAKPIREVHPKLTKYGTLHRGDFRFVRDGDLSEYNGGPFTRIVYQPFNAASHKQVVDVLNSAGWAPTEKTDTHVNYLRELAKCKRSHSPEKELDIERISGKLLGLSKYGWKVNENNLSSLPSKDQCRLKLENRQTLIIASMIKDLNDALKEMRGEKNIIEQTKNSEIKEKQKLSLHIIKIQEYLKTDNSERITEFLLKILNECLSNNKDVARFVEKQKHLWLIIVTPQGTFVDFSASYVTDTSDGLKDLKDQLKNIFYEAPPPARLLSKRIIRESRRRTLTEWLSLLSPDGRIHGDFAGIGAWTHRMAHQKPNLANIPNEFQGDGTTKKFLGKELRSIWTHTPGRILWGVDADSIQFRVAAHYINDPKLTDRIVNGRKANKTDPHSYNKSILGRPCKGRQPAKRFLYSLILGAGPEKLASILECSIQDAEAAAYRLIKEYPGIDYLKREVVPSDAKRGFFIGLDGRKVPIPGSTISERKHLAPSGYLQCGEAVIIKLSAAHFFPKLEPLDSFLVDIIHDEYQGESPNKKIALEACSIVSDSIKWAGEELKLNCPMQGSFYDENHKRHTIGENWYTTH